MIIKNCKRRKTDLGMAWIDYRKAFDMIPHSWILKCLRLFGAAENMVHYIEKSMGQWQVELSVNGNILGTVNVRRGIFQGDSLSPLLFLVTVIPLSLVLREVKAGYDFTGKKDLVNHLLYMDDLKLYGRKEKQIDTLINTVRILLLLFTPLVFTTTGGMGKECIRYHSRLAELIAAKKGEQYSQTISWTRARTSFALLRSALVCLRGSRVKRRAAFDYNNCDIEIAAAEGAIDIV